MQKLIMITAKLVRDELYLKDSLVKVKHSE